LNGTRIRFKGTVNGEGRFALDFAAPVPDAMLCLLRTIQRCLALMPAITREFYAAMMEILASDAENREGLSKDLQL
jgi:hypothetical protein